MSEGWTWGSHRDDEKKKHPDRVLYDDFSESEKDYDRNTAMETIKTIIASGYGIERV